MAYLSKKEIESLKKTPLLHRLIYIFSLRRRMRDDQTAQPSEQQIQADISPLVSMGDSGTPVIDADALDERLSEMRSQGVISPTDVRKIKALLLS